MWFDVFPAERMKLFVVSGIYICEACCGVSVCII
jgi:hypothetical protein